MASDPITPPAGIDVWRPPGRDDLVLYRGTRVSHPYPRHWHDELHLCAYTAGRGLLECRGRSFRVGAGDFVVTPAGEPHRNWVEPGESVSFRSVYLELSTLAESARQIADRGGPPVFAALLPRSRRAAASFLRMYRAMERPESRLERDVALAAFLRDLVTGCAERPVSERRVGREQPAIRRVREYIDAHFAEPIPLAQLSRVAGRSAFHLLRAFRDATGLPPHRYQTLLRINAARRLLNRGTDLAAIARETGFADQSHLTRHFRRLVGTTPGRFRADARALPQERSRPPLCGGA